MKWNKLSRFLPGFSRKPRSPKPKPAPVTTVAAPQTQPPAAPTPEPIPEPAKPTKPSRMLDDICAFLARYLHCSPEQRTVLALWILHTHSFAAARSTPYLAIQSARKLSGKSLCLRLLSLLSAHPALTSGYTAAALVKRIHSYPSELPTFLLDESPATLGSRVRARNPKLRAILVSGFQPGIGYSDHSFECTIFSPKAFASLGPLPEALADCSIPILLEPLQNPEQFGIERFDLLTAEQEAQPLAAALENWARKNLSALKSAPVFKYKDFPERLTWRGQDLVEPLLHLADLVGGDYPARARQALLHLFDDPARQQQDIAIQLLSDLRACFEHHRWPDALPTSLILADLRSLPTRPWDIDGPITDRALAKILGPYNIRPRVIRKKGSTVGPSTARGYQQQDFVNIWHNLLDNPQPLLGEAGLRAEPSVTGAGKFVGNSGHSSGGERSDKTNKDAACDAVTHAHTGSEICAHQRQSAAKDSGFAVGSAAAAGRNLSPVTNNLSPASGQEPRANGQKPSIHAACDAVTLARTGSEISANQRESAAKDSTQGPMAKGQGPVKTDPRINGILDNPLNYYRQYLEDRTGKLRYLIENRHQWPQPADDKLPPDAVYSMPDGARIPFTLINRHPTDPKPILGLPDFWTQRWPVMLNNEERLRVATARFYELLAAAKSAMEQKQTEAKNNREPVSSAVS